jgi:hypothetical protein
MLARTPRYGLRLDDETLTTWSRGPETRVALADIDHVAFRGVTESSFVTVQLRGGDKARIVSDCFPPAAKAIAELTARGVRTTHEDAAVT